MGPELLIPALMAVGGTAMQMSAQREQANERRSVLNQQLQRNDDATTKSIDSVQREGQNYGVEQRLAALKNNEQKSFDQTQADLAGAGGASVGTAGGAGNVSEDFLKSKASRAIDEGTRLTSVAREAAKTRAPGMLTGDDALRRAGMAGDLQSLWGTTGNMGRANGLDAEGVQEPGYGALGKIASSIGTSMAAGQMMKGAGMAKYAGSSNVATAPNYVNSMDAGIRW